MSDDTPRITPRENGPLIAKNVVRFILPDGREAGVKAIRALCRCGESKNKPYCDGSHKEAGFDSAPQDVRERDKTYSYEAAGIAVHYNKLLCSHAGECNSRAPSIFDPGKRPWVQFGADDLALLEEVVAACPSGALSLEIKGTARDWKRSDKVEIRAEKNGPLRVKNVAIDAGYWADGQTTQEYVLCRCGHSGNKPFCDGSHIKAGWKED